MKKLVLIDGHSILNRAFYGIPTLTNSAGLHTNAVYGFLNILFKILDDENADYLAVAFDLHAPTFRHKEYPEYKGNRKPMPEELREQVPLMKEVLQKMNVPILTKEGYEADDIIGTVAKRFQKEGLEVSVVSGDRDLLQLSDEHILIRIPKTKRGQTQIYDYRPEDVKAEYQVTPLEFIDVKALMGDPSDNIPGVPSIGEKTATAIIAEFHSIENAYAHVDELKPPRARKALEEHYDMAQFSKWLATICLDAPVETGLEEMEIGNLYTPEAYEEMKRLEFRSMLKRFDESAKQSAGKKAGEPEFVIVTTEDAAEETVKKALAEERLGLQLTSHGLSLCFSSGEVVVLRVPEPVTVETPFGEAEETLPENALTETYLEGAVRKLYDRVPEIFVTDLKPILHRIGFEERNNIRDCSVAAYLLNPLKDSYRAEDLARDYLDLLIPNQKEDPVRSDEWTSFTAFSAGPVLLEKLQETGMERLFTEVEMPLVYALAAMEAEGVKVDGDRLHLFAEELLKGIAKVEEEIYAETGEKFNINSPKQLGEILFEKMKLPSGKKTKSGYSTAADILEKLAPEYPVVRKILEYRTLTKLNSTYATGLAAYISEDGRIHGTFNQTITATGRISSTEPNLQNIPIRTEMGSRIRDVFVPKDGYVFVDADYSQIELRVLASLSGDENLISAYSHAVDIHAATASQVFHVPLEEVTPQLRRNAKAVNFGVVYGISAFGLSEGLSITRAEAKDYINNYFRTYPKVKEFLDRQIREAQDLGYTRTLFGRIRPVPELKSSNFMQRAFGERVAMNAPIQGTAADIMKIAMVQVHRVLKEEGLDAKIVLQIHDELLVEVSEKDADRTMELLKDTMKKAADLKVPLEVDAHKGHSWLEAH
ncbi:MAG: DNA polymerase I [Stomatobaculum sp.]|nr:DNA polymerase I [Stomatobaculum sp.]